MDSATRFFSLLIVALLAFAAGGCARPRETVVDESGVLRKPSSSHPIHGEVGVFYGQGGSRR